jgi:hypothetical protein
MLNTKTTKPVVILTAEEAMRRDLLILQQRARQRRVGVIAKSIGRK